MSAFVDEELHRFASLWWLVVLFGLAVLGVGVFFVASPHETLSTFTVIAGIFYSSMASSPSSPLSLAGVMAAACSPLSVCSAQSLVWC